MVALVADYLLLICGGRYLLLLLFLCYRVRVKVWCCYADLGDTRTVFGVGVGAHGVPISCMSYRLV